MAKKQVFVVWTSRPSKASYRNPAVGSLKRVHRRFGLKGKFSSATVVGYHTYAGRTRTIIRVTYGWGTNQVSSYDYFEA